MSTLETIINPKQRKAKKGTKSAHADAIYQALDSMEAHVLPLSALVQSELNVRKRPIDEKALSELADSIQAVGVLQNLGKGLINMEQQTQLSIGQIVYTNLYNLGKGVIVNIHGKQKPESIQNIHDIMVTGGNAEFDIVFFNGEETQRLPESILHGIQWQIENDHVDKETIEALIQKAETFEKAKITEEEQKQHEFNQGVELQRNNEKYNHLTQRESKSDSEIKLVGKNIRADLKKHFPKTKFSVRMRHYTAYSISWSDGPTVDNVDSILMKYKTGHFNAYEDYHYNEDTPFNVIYGGVDYVFTDRKYSDKKIEMAIQFLLKKHGEFYHFDTNLMTVENFRRGKLWNVGLEQVRGNNGIQGEIHRVLSETTY